MSSWCGFVRRLMVSSFLDLCVVLQRRKCCHGVASCIDLWNHRPWICVLCWWESCGPVIVVVCGGRGLVGGAAAGVGSAIIQACQPR
eukprot:924178-Karenia_brevis.AAC.1